MLLCNPYWEKSTGTKTHRCWSPNRQLTRVVVFVIRYQHCRTISHSMALSQVGPTSLCMGQTWILDPTYQSPWLARLARWSAKYTSKCWWCYPELIGNGLAYRWRELPQVSFLLRQKFCHDKHEFVTTKHVFCHDKSMLAAAKLLSRQIMFVVTKYFLLRENFIVATNIILSWRKTCFVATNTCLSWQK